MELNKQELIDFVEKHSNRITTCLCNISGIDLNVYSVVCTVYKDKIVIYYIYDNDFMYYQLYISCKLNINEKFNIHIIPYKNFLYDDIPRLTLEKNEHNIEIFIKRLYTINKLLTDN